MTTMKIRHTTPGVTDLRGKTGNLFTLKQGGDGSGDEAGGAVGVAGGVGRYFRDASSTGGGGERGGGGGGERGMAAVPAAAPSLFGYGARARTTGRGGGGLLRSLRADAEAGRDGLPRRRVGRFYSFRGLDVQVER